MKSIVDELREERASRQIAATVQPVAEPDAGPMLDAELMAAE
jgi:hypothetical protein